MEVDKCVVQGHPGQIVHKTESQPKAHTLLSQQVGNTNRRIVLWPRHKVKPFLKK
jgi:hypothetical protein